jgi:chromosome segregation ATPase
MDNADRTASLMTPAKLAQVKPKGPASPAAWLNQMAADAGHQHVRRLTELCKDIQAQIQALHGGIASLASKLGHLGEALPRLDFGLLHTRGWWARTTGKSRTAGAEFARQFEQIEALAKALAVQAQAVQKVQQEQLPGAERALLEVEVEFRAMEKIIDQGARWLQDMRNQIKERQTATADAATLQQAKDDAARCEILVARLKALRAASSAVQQAHQQAQATAARRASLGKLLQEVATEVKAWQARVSALASVAGDGDSASLSPDEAMETHRELQLRIKQAMTDCGQLQAQETVLAERLGAMGAQLEAAR